MTANNSDNQLGDLQVKRFSSQTFWLVLLTSPLRLEFVPGNLSEILTKNPTAITNVAIWCLARERHNP